jgi:hypothetical protein
MVVIKAYKLGSCPSIKMHNILFTSCPTSQTVVSLLPASPGNRTDMEFDPEITWALHHCMSGRGHRIGSLSNRQRN